MQQRELSETTQTVEIIEARAVPLLDFCLELLAEKELSQSQYSGVIMTLENVRSELATYANKLAVIEAERYLQSVGD